MRKGKNKAEETIQLIASMVIQQAIKDAVKRPKAGSSVKRIEMFERRRIAAKTWLRDLEHSMYADVLNLSDLEIKQIQEYAGAW